MEGGQNYGVNAIQPQIITTDPEGYAYLCGWVAGIAEKPHAGWQTVCTIVRAMSSVAARNHKDQALNTHMEKKVMIIYGTMPAASP